MIIQKTLRSSLVAFGLVLSLGACGSNGEPNSDPTNPEVSTVAPTTEAQTTSESAAGGDGHAQVSQGGQVIESGPYHLELVTANEPTGIHLDFFLQKSDNHEAIADAQVRAEIQFPDGQQESLEMTYDADGAHYKALLPTTATGEYNIVILSDIGGEKVNGRFTFTQ